MHNVVITDELLNTTWTVEVLEPMETITYTVDYVVTQADSNRGSVTNVVTASAETDNPNNPNPAGQDEITTPVETQTPSLVITKTADITSGAVAGDVITYTIVATNSGTAELTNVAIADPLTADAWTIAQLAPGASQTFTTTYTVTLADMAAGAVVNTVTGSADNPTDTPTNVTPDTETTVTVTPAAGMSINKTILGTAANSQFYVQGEEITYQVSVTNTGNVELTNIVLSDTLVPLDSIATLAPGATRDITYTYTVTADDVEAGFVTNTVTGIGSVPDEIATFTPGGGGAAGSVYGTATYDTSATDTSEVTAQTGMEVIEDNPTPLAQACWVHWWIMLGALLTLIYGAGVIIRRKKFTHSIAALDKELTGENDTETSAKQAVATTTN